MNKIEKLYNPVHLGNLPPCYGGIIRIADQYDGASTGYPANLTRIYANEEAILAKFFNCAKHAVRQLTPEKLNTLTQLVLNMEDTKGISAITKNL